MNQFRFQDNRQKKYMFKIQFIFIFNNFQYTYIYQLGYEIVGKIIKQNKQCSYIQSSFLFFLQILLKDIGIILMGVVFVYQNPLLLLYLLVWLINYIKQYHIFNTAPVLYIMTQHFLSKKQIAQIAMDMTSNVYMNSTTKFTSGLSDLQAKHTNIQQLKQRALNSIALKTNPDKKLSIQKVSQLGSSPLFKGLDNPIDRKAKTLEKQQRQISWKVSAIPNPQQQKKLVEKANRKGQNQKQQKAYLERQHNRKIQNEVNSSRYRGTSTEQGNVVSKQLNKSNKIIRDDFDINAKFKEREVSFKLPKKQDDCSPAANLNVFSNKKKDYVYPTRTNELSSSRAISDKNQSTDNLQKNHKQQVYSAKKVNSNLSPGNLTPVNVSPVKITPVNISPAAKIQGQNKIIEHQKEKKSIPVKQVQDKDKVKFSQTQNTTKLYNSTKEENNRKTTELIVTNKVEKQVQPQLNNYNSTPSFALVNPKQVINQNTVKTTKKQQGKQPYVYVPPSKVVKEPITQKVQQHSIQNQILLHPQTSIKQITSIKSQPNIYRNLPASDNRNQVKQIKEGKSGKANQISKTIKKPKQQQKATLKGVQKVYQPRITAINNKIGQTKVNSNNIIEIKKTPEQSRVMIQKVKPLQKSKPVTTPSSYISKNMTSNIQSNNLMAKNSTGNINSSKKIITNGFQKVNDQKNLQNKAAVMKDNSNSYIYQPPKKVQKSVSPKQKIQQIMSKTNNIIRQQKDRQVSNSKQSANYINKANNNNSVSIYLNQNIYPSKVDSKKISANYVYSPSKNVQSSIQKQYANSRIKSITKNHQNQPKNNQTSILIPRKNVHMNKSQDGQAASSKNVSIQEIKNMNKYQKSYTPQKSKEKLSQRGRVAMNMISNIFMNSSTRFFPGLQTLLTSAQAQELKKKALQSPMFKNYKSQQKTPTIRVIQSKSRQKNEQIDRNNTRTSPSRPKRIERNDQQLHLGQSHSVYKTKQTELSLQKKGSNNLVSKQLSKEKVTTRDDSFLNQKKSKIEEQSKSKQSPNTFKRDIDISKKQYNQMKKLRQKQPNTPIIQPIPVSDKKKISPYIYQPQQSAYVYQPPQPKSEKILQLIDDSPQKLQQKKDNNKITGFVSQPTNRILSPQEKKAVSSIKNQSNLVSQTSRVNLINQRAEDIKGPRASTKQLQSGSTKPQQSMNGLKNNFKKVEVPGKLQQTRQSTKNTANISRQKQENELKNTKLNQQINANEKNERNIKKVDNSKEIKVGLSNLQSAKKADVSFLPIDQKKKAVNSQNAINIDKSFSTPTQTLSKIKNQTQRKFAILLYSVKKILRNKVFDSFQTIQKGAKQIKSRRTSEASVIYYRVSQFVQDYHTNQKRQVLDLLKRKRLAIISKPNSFGNQKSQQKRLISPGNNRITSHDNKNRTISFNNECSYTNSKNVFPQIKLSNKQIFKHSIKIQVLSSLNLILQNKKKSLLKESFAKIGIYKKQKQSILKGLAFILSKVKGSSTKNDFDIFKIANLTFLKTKSSHMQKKTGGLNGNKSQKLTNISVMQKQQNKLSSSKSLVNLGSSSSDITEGQYEFKKSKKNQQFKIKVKDIQIKKGQAQQSISFQNKQKRTKTKLNNDLKLRLQSIPATLDQQEHAQPIKKIKQNASLSENSLVPKLTKMYASLFEGDGDVVKIEQFLSQYGQFMSISINQNMMSQWKLILQNSSLKNKIKQYEGQQVREKKMNQLMSEQSSLLSRLLKSFIRERYIWEWVNIIANQ